MRFTSLSIVFALVSSMVFVTGCYKKDLEEFKGLNSMKYSPEVSIAFLIANVTLDDTIPLVPAYTTVIMSDTASIEIPKGEEKDSVESAVEYINFRVVLTNSFPYNGFVQLYFADTSGAYVDSLLDNTQRIVTSGSPVVSESSMDILVDQQRYKSLTQTADKMYLVYKLTASDITGIEDDSLNVKIGINAKLNIDLKK